MADVTTPFGFPYPESTDLVRDGATDIEALAQAANDQFSAGFQFAGQRIYTSSGQFAKADPLLTGDIGLRAIRVRLVGAGGGGGGCATTGAGQVAAGRGGGGGAFAESFITDIAGLASSESVTRGAGGAGGAAGNTSGSNGGNSSFGSLVIGEGGGFQGADGSAQTAPFKQSTPGGAVGGTGDLVIQGGTPLDYVAFASGLASGQEGAGSFLALPRRGTSVLNFGANGADGLAHGGGGSAGHNHQNQGTARSGGAGANGVVIVEVFV